MENSLKNLNLTDNDFKMLIDGLDALPQRGQIGELMVDLLASTMIKNPESRIKIERELELKKKKQESAKEILIEDAKILQGKLLMLKRYLAENKMLAEVNEVLNPEKK